MQKNFNLFGEYKPENFVINIFDDEGNQEKYMKIQGRIIAFRTMYPDGKIGITYQYVPEINVFIVTAYVYSSKDDPSENYLACDVGTRIFVDNNSLPEAATQAISRALGRAGFGTCYSSPDESEQKIAEAGVKVPKTTANTADAAEIDDKPEETERTPVKETPAQETAKPVKGKRGRPRKNPEPPVVTVPEEKRQEVEQGPEETTNAVKASEIPASTSASDESFPKTIEEAKLIMIPFGTKKGQLMGEVLVTDPRAILWYAEKYSGPNEVIKQAAKLIVEGMPSYFN